MAAGDALGLLGLTGSTGGDDCVIILGIGVPSDEPDHCALEYACVCSSPTNRLLGFLAAESEVTACLFRVRGVGGRAADSYVLLRDRQSFSMDLEQLTIRLTEPLTGAAPPTRVAAL